MKLYFAMTVAVVFWSAIPGAAPASAQQASSFEQLQVLVEPGDQVKVLGADGTLAKGKIESLTPASLRLRTEGKIRDYAQKDALVIKQRKGDSLANGAVIGAISGAGFGLLALIGSGGCDCTGGEVAGIVLEFSLIGTGIGMGIDALIRHYKPVYALPSQIALNRLRVAPLIANGRKGLAVRFSFK